MQKVLHCLSLILALYCASVEAQQGNPWDLPKDLIPIKYQLTLVTFLEKDNLSFSGEVIIEMNCNKATNIITLHAKDLTIGDKDVTVTFVKSAELEEPLAVSSHGYKDENDFYAIEIDGQLTESNVYRVQIKFQGKLSNSLDGYYVSSYEQDGEPRWMASTMFESIGARKCFPCLDEPALKAKFQISMAHAPNLKAVSNMPLKETKPLTSLHNTDSLVLEIIYYMPRTESELLQNQCRVCEASRRRVSKLHEFCDLTSVLVISINGKDDWVLDTFDESPVMSTYVTGFALGEFEFVQVSDAGKTPNIGIWIRKQFLQQIDLAKKTVMGAVSFFAERFQVDYPLPKLDMVAVLDQNRGGMETFGMMTLSELVITYDPKSSNAIDEYRTAQIICNCTCHQWLGNLVTMALWSDLWLDEGFCSYFEELCVANIFPDWQSLDQMFFRKYMFALTADSLTSSHPIIIPIKTPTDINQIFDSIILYKGAFVVRMISMFLGDDVFQKGLISYVQKHKFGAVTSEDMWAALTDAEKAAKILPEDLTLTQIMDSWTKQPGYPFVDVKIDYSKKSATLTQTRYLSEDSSTNDKPSPVCYNIPISLTTSKNPKFEDIDTKPTSWLTCQGPITIPADIEEGQWLLLNIRVSSFYRTSYDEKNLQALHATLSKKDTLEIIGIMDRSQIISNIFGSSWIGLLGYDVTFKMITYLENENAYTPWRTALESFHDMRDLLVRTEIFEPFQEFVRSFLEPKFLSIGDISKIPDDFASNRYNSLIIYWACVFGVKDCHDQSVKIFEPWMQQQSPDTTNPILPNLRDIVYCEAMKTGDEKIFNFMWDRYMKAAVPTEQSTILSALGCTLKEDLLKRILEWSIDSSKIRREDSAVAYWVVVSSDSGFNVARDFLFQRFPDILKYHGPNADAISEEIRNLTEMMISKEDLQQFQDFVNTNKDQLEGFNLIIQEGLARINKNIAWETKHLEELKKILTGSRAENND